MSAPEPFEQAFWQAVNDMKDGAAKPIESYLLLVPINQRDELAQMLADVLLARGSAPMPSSEESDGYDRAVAAIDEVLASMGSAGMLPSALRKMRTARGIEPEQVVAHLTSDFEIKGEAGRRALARNYHRLETGKLLGTKLARRLLESLAVMFEIDVRDLLAGAAPRGKSPRLSRVPALGRSAGSPSLRPTPSARKADLLPDPEVERVERLFQGGPDA